MPIVIITGIRNIVMSRLSLNNYKDSRKWMWQFEKVLHFFVKKVVVNSEFIKKQMIKDEAINQEKVMRIYSGIKLDGFDLDRKQKLREKLGLSSEQLILVMVANLIPYKGHADLISALGLISDEMPKDWKMIFIGRDDGIKTALIDQTKKYNISENCEFLHSKGDTTDYYAIADIGILSSHEEGFSVAILEGMRAALPMVVTNVGGNSESVLDGKTGFVVPAKDCQKISEAILKLCLDKELRQSMGQSANQRVKDNFSIESCINEHHVLYSNLI
jgi:glycosyltransferase involved in cell wall biosynthesis